MSGARKLLCRPIRREPAHIDHFLVVTEGVDSHRHIVISRNNLPDIPRKHAVDWSNKTKVWVTNLLKVFTESALQQLGVFVKELQEEIVKSRYRVSPALDTGEHSSEYSETFFFFSLFFFTG